MKNFVYFSFILAVICPRNTFSQTCNVQTGNSNTFSSILPAEFSANDLKLTRFAALEDAETLTLVNAGNSGITSAVWYTEQKRVIGGFRAELLVQYNGGQSDGFAFVVQNDKIVNVFGSGGGNLGFRDDLESFLAVTLDTCSNRVEDPNCGQATVEVVSRAGSGNVQVLATASFDASTLTNGNVQTVTVDFLQDIGDFGQVQVFVPGQQAAVAEGSLTQSLEETIGSEFAFLGLSSSNSENSPATITLKRLTLLQMNAPTRLADRVALSGSTAEFGSRFSVSLVEVDSCDAPLTGDDVTINETLIRATLTETDTENPLEIVADEISEQSDGSFQIIFLTPDNVEATWDLNITVNGVLSQNMPAENFLVTESPDANGLTQQGIILLVCLILVLVIITIYMVKRLDYFRKKLIEHEEDIDYGHVKEEIEKIDKDIEYTMNPMIAPLDEMKEKLEKNMRTLEELRKGQSDGLDANFTIEQLVKENEKLREEMNRLKKEEQLMEAGNRAATQGRRKIMGGQGNVRKDFGQERA